MRNSMKILSIIMVMIMMMLAACAQDNTSNNGSSNSGSTSTGVVGRWKDTDNFVYEFTSGNIIYMDGSVYGRYYGNDAEGELLVNDIWFYYTVSSNSMTWTKKNDSSVKEYLTRM